MIIAVASGKGGTGKTMVSVNLAEAFDSDVQLLDCDVEEPNAHLFLPGVDQREEAVFLQVPEVDDCLCVACGECARFCAYNAIACFGDHTLVFPEMCHGCGGCAKVCRGKAIRETRHRIGAVTTRQAGRIALVQGRLAVGAALSPPVIRAVKRHLRNGGLAILDAPPGTSCPAIATLQGADFALLVAEPTPFGLHDLRMAVDVVRQLSVPFGVIVNRIGIGDGRVHSYCRDAGIPVLLEIPEDRRVAEACSRGEAILDAMPEYRHGFERLARRLRDGQAGEERI